MNEGLAREAMRYLLRGYVKKETSRDSYEEKKRYLNIIRSSLDDYKKDHNMDNFEPLVKNLEIDLKEWYTKFGKGNYH